MYMLNTFKNPAPIPTPTNETRKKNEQTDSLNNSVGTVIVSGMSISFSFLHAKAIVLQARGRMSSNSIVVITIDMYTGGVYKSVGLNVDTAQIFQIEQTAPPKKRDTIPNKNLV